MQLAEKGGGGGVTNIKCEEFKLNKKTVHAALTPLPEDKI
jgi:hypothetical protein